MSEHFPVWDKLVVKVVKVRTLSQIHECVSVPLKETLTSLSSQITSALVCESLKHTLACSAAENKQRQGCKSLFVERVFRLCVRRAVPHGVKVIEIHIPALYLNGVKPMCCSPQSGAVNGGRLAGGLVIKNTCVLSRPTRFKARHKPRKDVFIFPRDI